MNSNRYFLLPGTGADGRLFPPSWDDLPGRVVRVDWRECAGAKTIGEAAAALIDRHGIGDADWVIGVSLGGMVACEIANRTRVAAVVLVASCVHPRVINPLLRFLHPVIRVLPIRLAQRVVARSSRPVFRMFAEGDPDFIRDMIMAIFRWEGLRDAERVRPLRLHARDDWVIRCEPDAEVKFSGGHMFMVRQAAGCVAAIRAQVREPVSP